MYVYITVKKHSLLQDHVGFDLDCIPPRLTSLGYDTAFLTGSNPSFDNIMRWVGGASSTTSCAGWGVHLDSQWITVVYFTTHPIYTSLTLLPPDRSICRTGSTPRFTKRKWKAWVKPSGLRIACSSKPPLRWERGKRILVSFGTRNMCICLKFSLFWNWVFSRTLHWPYFFLCFYHFE